MTARKKRKNNRTPPAVPVHVRDQLNTVVAVVQTVFAALTEDEENEPLAVTLFECAVLPLRRIRDALEAP